MHPAVTIPGRRGDWTVLASIAFLSLVRQTAVAQAPSVDHLWVSKTEEFLLDVGTTEFADIPELVCWASDFWCAQ